MPRSQLIQLRAGTAAAWTSVNPVLAANEPGYETDTGKEKRGDGTTVWSALPYITDISRLPTSVVNATAAASLQVPIAHGDGSYSWGAQTGSGASVPLFVSDSAPAPATGFGEYLWFEMDGNGNLLDIQAGKA